MRPTRLIRRIAVHWRRASRRRPWLGQPARAWVCYQRADGRRLAAAVTYYGFFATFAMGLLGFAALGYVVDDPAAAHSVQQFLDQNLPLLDAAALRDARSTVGLLALATLPVIGLLWVDSLRSSVRAVWQIDQYPGRFFTRYFVDALALTALGGLLAISLTVAFGAEALLAWLLQAVAGADLAPARWLLAATRFALGLGVNTLLAIAVLTLLPRLRMPARRVLPPALLVAGGVELLTGVGRLAVERAETNPAFQVVAGAAGLLVFLLILNQLILFAAALTATSRSRGRVTDLATGQPLAETAAGVAAAVPSRPRRRVARPPGPRRPPPPRQVPRAVPRQGRVRPAGAATQPGPDSAPPPDPGCPPGRSAPPPPDPSKHPPAPEPPGTTQPPPSTP